MGVGGGEVGDCGKLKSISGNRAHPAPSISEGMRIREIIKYFIFNLLIANSYCSIQIK